MRILAVWLLASSAWAGVQNSGSLGSATNPAIAADNLANGSAGQIPYQTGAGATGFFGNCSSTQVVQGNGTGAPQCVASPTISTLTALGNAFSVGGSTFVVSGSSVGIDTSSPMTALDVNGPAQFGFGATKSTFTFAGSLALDPAAVLLTGGASASNGTAIIRSTSTTAANPVLAVQNASGAELWQFTQAGNECLGGQLCATTMDIGGNVYTGGTLACPASGFDLTLKCAPNNVLFNTNSVERMRVANNGNIGIGTNAPGTLLDVNGGATIRGQSTFVSSATFRNANPSLEVGVLSLANAVIDSPESLEFFVDATNVYTTSSFRWGKGSNGFGGGTELMRLQENGNLGIGLTAPGTLLDVNGGATVRGQETVTSSTTILGTGNSVYSLTTSSGINVQAGGIALAAGGFINLNGSVYTNPDYVFDPNYGQMSLAELRDYVAENRHLPNVPSTAEVKAHGVEIFGQNRSVLENLENAYLYIFKLNDKLERQNREIEELRRRMN